MTLRSHLDEAQRLELICETIGYCRRIRDMGGPAAVWRKALRKAVYFTWEARKGGKIVSARYRSKAACGIRFGERKVGYEHAIPVRVVQDKLMDLDDPMPDAVRDILDRMLRLYDHGRRGSEDDPGRGGS